MRSPITALTWEIWQRNRRTAWLVLGIILFGWLFNLVLPDNFRATAANREHLTTVNGLLTVASLLLVFGVFNYYRIQSAKRLDRFSVSSLCVAGCDVAAGRFADVTWNCCG